MKLSHKVFAATFVISLCALIGVAFHTVDRITDILVARALDGVQENVHENSRILSDALETTKAELHVLSSMLSVRKSLSATPPPIALRELQQVFARLISATPYYSQVRLISAENNGLEIVRAERVESSIVIRQADELQAKGSRYYVTETLQLDLGEVFISDLDLNREFGAIVEPHQPVFRVAVPVHNETRQNPLGILVINVDFKEVAKRFRYNADIGYPVVTNMSGAYLHHPDDNKTFAWEFGRDETLPGDFAIATQWNAWAEGSKAVPLSLTTHDHIISVQHLDAYTQDKPNAVDWVIGAILSRTAINAIGTSLREHLYITLALISILLALALGAITAWLMRPITDLTEAANAIAEGQPDVEIFVTSRDEVGVLAKALDQMLHSLREMARNEELATMGRMAVMIAHDLRNALSAVKMNLQILNTQVDDPDLLGQIEIALAQALHMENILRDLMSYSKPDRLQPDWQDTCNMLDTCAAAVLPNAHASNISLTKSYSTGIPAIYCDRTKILQAVQNLLHNAIQAVGEGGEVDLRAYSDYSDGQHAVIIKVTDNGHGIDAEILETLFDPFTTTRAKGTGLGLAIVHRIVEQHGGDVWAHDRKDTTGAEFGLCLPIEGLLAMSDAP
ncbi:ATP-binding protein [Magnetovibrio sp. PR-2]|uniref:ATP-binding protein n=1 Tax=Magnetovibrio sp. PR-2 TaxID=3120356 RepID=UPI002FCE2A51